MNATLTPTSYVCAAHGNDLTAEVGDQVASDPTRVANFGFSFRRRSRNADQPFTVVVRCPGSGGDAHEVEFEGTFRP